MLNSILHAKAGRYDDGEERVSWRETFRAIEDHITASIFERLSYLSAPCAIRILHEATSRNHPGHADELFRWKAVGLEKLEFWPRWEDPGKDQRSREPDVYMEWSVGDPERRLHVIVEAKPGAVFHLEPQWRGELASYHYFQATEGAETPDIIGFLAVGGRIPDIDAFLRAAAEVSPTVLVAVASWEDVARAVHYELQRSSLRWEQRILHDMSEALTLFGYLYVPFSPALKSMQVVSEKAIWEFGGW